MAVAVADDDEHLEPGSRAGTRLLLDWHDLHEIVLETGQGDSNDLVVLEGERV